MNEAKSKPKFPAGLLWSITVLVWLLSVVWLLDLLGDGNSVFSALLFIACQVLCQVVFIIDVAGSDIFNKTGWIIMLIIIPLISFPVYLIQRKKLLRIQRRADDFTKSSS
jgi:hypothetical protein